MTPPTGRDRLVEVDLSSFSLGRHPAWAHPVAVFVGLLLWFLLLIFVATRGAAREAMAAGVATMLVILVGFVVTTIQRMSRSTTGQAQAIIHPEDADKRPAHFEASLGAIMEQIAELRGTDTPADVAMADPARGRKRIRATLYIVLGLLIVLVGIPLVIATRPGGALLGPAIILLVWAMYAMFTRARRITQPGADLMTEHDPRPPILFLRSFQDDRIKLIQRVSLLGAPATQQLRFEEALGLMLRGFGPFLAVGDPAEGLPQLGAARAYLAEDKWQEAVRAWIKSARLIVMLAGPTPWIRWELQNVVREQKLDNLLLLLPSGRTAQATDQRLARWSNVVQSLADTAFFPALELVDARDTLLVQFRPDGRVLAYHSQYDLAQDYELALTLAIHEALAKPREPESRIAVDPAPAVKDPATAPARADPQPRRYVARESGVRGIGAWLVVQGLLFIALFIPFIQHTMRIPSNYRSTALWAIVTALLLLGMTTSGVGFGAFLQRRRVRIVGLIVCAIGAIVFIVLSVDLFRMGLGRIGRDEIVMLLSPAFALGYVVAFVLLWRWRREEL